MKRLLGLLFSVLAAASARAQFKPDEMLLPYSYTNEQGEVFACRLWAPQFPEPGRKYPLIVFLHGSGEMGSDNLRQIRLGVPVLLAKLLMTRREPVMVLAPQCQLGNAWVRHLAFASDYRMSRNPTPAMDVMMQLCRHLVAARAADPDRIYITGLSLGGFGTWDAIARYPGFFAAAAPLCGGGDVTTVSRFRDLPVWVFHGADDQNVPPDCSRRMAGALEKVGGNVRYTEYPKVAHDCWDRVYSDPEFLDWLLSQRRGAAKKRWWRFW